jgi:tRNA pseudouridine32 synthase/23S rRNA pseudouridine746 synthase
MTDTETSSAAAQQFHIVIDQPNKTAAQWLAGPTGLSKTRLKKIMQQGAVWLSQGKTTRRLRRAAKVLVPGEELHCYLNEQVLAAQCPPAKLVEDCGDYSVWYKPRGMFSQGSKWGDHSTLQRFAELHLQPARNAFVVHRLDRATEGLMLLAHSKKAAAIFSRLFEQRQIHKTYRAWVVGDYRQQASPQTVALALQGKHAVSHITFLRFDEGRQQSLVEVAIETGRKHQIRQHLASLGFAIVGDRLYGNAVAGDADLQLTAWQLAFSCPLSGEPKNYCAAAFASASE